MCDLPSREESRTPFPNLKKVKLLNFMKINTQIQVSASFSITNKIETVNIIMDNGDLTYKVQYSNGYMETLPIAAFIGY
jgi:hypothetical protein